MNKWLSIGLAIAISAFIGTNAILLFSDKSIISKSVYTHEYDRVAAGYHVEELPKESLVSPLEISTVYVKNEDTIQDWLIKEGDAVTAGQELAALNTSSADEQRSVWESEKEALERQITEINTTISTLESERASTSGSTDNTTDNISEDTEDKTLNVGINVDVDVHPDAAYAQAIAEAEQKLSEVNQKNLVVDAQLAQQGTASVLSPVDGVVSKIRDEDGRLAIEIYSTEKVIITYATDEQWQDLQVNDNVLLQADGLEKAVEGVITEISQVPANDSDFLKAYKALDPKEQKNPLAYYEIRIQPNEPIDSLPFGNNANAMILVNEANDAVSVKSAWLYNRFEDKATAYVINEHGYAAKAPVSIAFDSYTRSILSDGMEPGAVMLNEPLLNDYRYAPAIFFPMPMDSPTWHSVKEAGWKFYLRHLIF
jgi:HlyD family secretion protein